MSEDLRERLAAIEHERWAHWQSWMHGVCQSNGDGSLTIPAELVERWERQIRTPYADLGEAEKKSDREQVDRYLPLVDADRDALAARLERAEKVVEAAREARTLLKSWYHDPDCSVGRRELQHFEGEKVCAHFDQRWRHQCAEALVSLIAAVDSYQVGPET